MCVHSHGATRLSASVVLPLPGRRRGPTGRLVHVGELCDRYSKSHCRVIFYRHFCQLQCLFRINPVPVLHTHTHTHTHTHKFSLQYSLYSIQVTTGSFHNNMETAVCLTRYIIILLLLHSIIISLGTHARYLVSPS